MTKSKKVVKQENVIEKEKLFNENGVEVTNFFLFNRSVLVSSKKEADKLIEKVGYYYPVFDKQKNQVGYGIPK